MLDAQPRYMGMNIGELVDPGPTEGFEFREAIAPGMPAPRWRA